jgi:hypothetical protein
LRCANDEPSGSVAAECARMKGSLVPGDEEALVFVVPPGEGAAVAETSFALKRPDGLTRYGAADRRGAVFERALPPGDVELGLPAELEE